MCGGGGYHAPEDRSVELEREREINRVAAEKREAARKAEEETTRRNTFNTNRDAALNSARDRTLTTVRNRGLSTDELGPLIEAALNTRKLSVPDLDPNPGSYFPETLADTILGNIQSDRRSAAGTQVSNLFTPGFESTVLPDTADDATWEQTVQDQFNNAMDNLTRARSRGTLTDAGFNAATQQLNTSRGAARAKAADLGQSVIASERGQLSNLAKEARDAASSYTLGGPAFDISPFSSRLATAKASAQSTLPGRVADAVGGTQFFDIGELISQGGNVQGAQNALGAAPLAEVLAQRERDRRAPRGVGGTGQF